ncbi:hypothetical protein Dimus_022964, partial [Dionaea muscipula]
HSRSPLSSSRRLACNSCATSSRPTMKQQHAGHRLAGCSRVRGPISSHQQQEKAQRLGKMCVVSSAETKTTAMISCHSRDQLRASRP